MSDDDEEVAISGDQEPEVAPGQAEPAAAGDDDGYDPEAEAEAKIGASEATRSRARAGAHPVTKEVRALLQKAANDIKQQMEAGEGDDDAIEYDEGERPAPGDKRSRPVGDESTAQATSPPAASLDPEVTKLREQLNTRGSELDAREKALAEREAKSSGSFGERYGEGNPVEALRDLLKHHGIISTDQDWQDEAADLISDLSGQVLGVQLPSELRNKIDAKRALRAVQIDRRHRADRDAAIERKQLEAQHQAQRSAFHNALTKELAKPEHAEAYSWLQAEEDPAAVIIEVADAQFRKDGTTLTWQQAAKRANDYLSSYGADFAEKRRHLLEKLPRRGTNGQPQRPSGKTSQGPSQVIATPQPPVEPPASRRQASANGLDRNWKEKHRESTRRAFRQAFKPE